MRKENGIEIAKLLLFLMQQISSAMFHDGAFGVRADDALLCCAVYIGHAEGRPMKAANLAEYTGIPRSTVTRKLKGFKRAGLFDVDGEGRVTFTDEYMREVIPNLWESNREIINRSATRLAKMAMPRVAKKSA
ncbi:helix-turn-helix domain-containing protein [Tardiphaga sp. 20_F10_N6_6]|uniref:helix-turn-helix domain-containing protein n=1 Tax=Tardiphaga sp. 20_F10_N6_6 TaxID=3240788 RepID=UPI003F8A80AE